MCTSNQKVVKSPKKGYKICRSGNPTKDEYISYYLGTIWKKGENIAAISPKCGHTPIEDQIGFHCFKFLKDAVAFAKKINQLSKFDIHVHKEPLYIITLTLQESKTSKVREGNNDICSPACNKSPCYIAPIAVWNGKITRKMGWLHYSKKTER